ncbi:MAG: dihydropteroate synthase [Akkermansiaceae bacterium]|nr:dihydropteroate synthase [Akkermansiaceae bacterium]
MIWKTRRQTLDLTEDTAVMGILNATPDSFSDGGEYSLTDKAIKRALQMIEEGAQIIDIGGESTRPGAEAVDASEEIVRTVPIIEALRRQSDVLISIDTSKVTVAEAAINAGADIVNDVTGMRDENMVHLCSGSGVGVCVMHMQGKPRTMQENPSYENEGGVLPAIQAFFTERLVSLEALGMNTDCICFDPGIGFGKSYQHNLNLLRGLGELQTSRPVLLGVSRKSVVGQLIGENDPAQRDRATAIVTALACKSGIKLHRVHDVKAAMEAIHITDVL